MTNRIDTRTPFGAQPGHEVSTRIYAPAAGQAQVQAGDALWQDGVSGPEISWLQQALTDAGFEVDVDGKFGPQTFRAVTRYQRDRRLGVDGKVGPKTLAALLAEAAPREGTRQGTTPNDDADRTLDGAQARSQRLVGAPQPRGTVAELLAPGRLRPQAVTTAGSTARRLPRIELLPTPPAGGAAGVAGVAGAAGAGAVAVAASRPPASTPDVASTSARPAISLSPVPPSLPPGRATGPFAAARSAREAQAEALLQANGVWPPQEGRVYVIQIDEDSPPATATRADRLAWLRNYTGQTAVFQVERGRLVERSDPFRSASHPGQMTARAGSFTSVDGDDIPDIAHLRSGVYEYHGATWNDRFNPVSHRAMRVARDIDHNGVINGDNENNPDFYATSLQIHAGGTGGPISVGCQTVDPRQWDRFKEALAPARREGFTYLLVRRDNERFGANPL